jgi:hypothetical protein
MVTLLLLGTVTVKAVFLEKGLELTQRALCRERRESKQRREQDDKTGRHGDLGLN